jgi:hypothetical protein
MKDRNDTEINIGDLVLNTGRRVQGRLLGQTIRGECVVEVYGLNKEVWAMSSTLLHTKCKKDDS